MTTDRIATLIQPANPAAYPKSIGEPDPPGERERGFILPLPGCNHRRISLALWAAISVIESAQNDITRLRDSIALETRCAYSRSSSHFPALWPNRLERPEFGWVDSVSLLSSRFSALGRATKRAISRAIRSSIPASFVRLDGRPYSVIQPGAPDLAVEVQDEAGLFNLNLQDPPAVRATA